MSSRPSGSFKAALFVITLILFLWAIIWWMQNRQTEKSDRALGPEALVAVTTTTTSPVGINSKSPATGPAVFPLGTVNSAKTDEAIISELRRISKGGDIRLSRASDGRVNSIQGISIESMNMNQEQSLSISQQVASILGIPVDQISKTSISGPETGFTQAIHHQQQYSGYDVDNGFIELFANRGSGKYFIISSELRELGTVKTEIQYSLRQALTQLEQLFPNRPFKVFQEPRDPVIFNKSRNISFLTWKIGIEFKTFPEEPWYYYISTVNGEIIHRYKLMKN